MLLAPVRSLFCGRRHSSFWQTRTPRIFLPIFFSSSAHGPHGQRHLQHVLLVYCSGVIATRKRFDRRRNNPTPTAGGLPLLHTTPAWLAIVPHKKAIVFLIMQIGQLFEKLFFAGLDFGRLRFARSLEYLLKNELVWHEYGAVELE